MKKSGNKRRTLVETPYTARDIQIVYAVFAKKYITTPQIKALYFPHSRNDKVCQQRLRKLRNYGFLRAIEQAAQWGTGRKPHIWALDRKGGELLIAECGVDAKLIVTKPWADEDRNLQIKHILATTDVHIAFQQAANHAGLVLETWLDERDLRSQSKRAAVKVVAADGQERTPPIPDAFLVLNAADKRGMFQLEVDRATEDLDFSTYERQSIAGKTLEYLAWEASAPYRQAFGKRPLQVLWVTTGVRRLRNMVGATESLLQQQVSLRAELSDEQKQAEWARLCKRFQFTTLAQVQADALLTQPIWQMAGSEILTPLLKDVAAHA